jgi:AcrR family transcriptional regulator
MSDLSRRERILAAAERLFQHYGQKKTTMADIARDVGIGVGSLYLDFPSKEALLSELALKRSRAVSEAMERARSITPTSERIVAMLEARVEALLRVAEEGIHACELITCGSSVESKGAPGLGAEARRALAAELELGKRSGEIDCGAIDEVLDALDVAFMALSPPFLFRHEPARAKETARRLGVLVVYGIARKP